MPIDWPSSLDCTDLKISVEPAVTQYCVASVTYKYAYVITQDIYNKFIEVNFFV